MTRLKSDHSSAILETRSNYKNCISNLSEEKLSHEVEVAKLRIHSDRNERAYQRSLREYLEETNTAYNDTNEALEKASARLKAEVERYESAQLRLSQVEEMLQNTQSAMAKSMKELDASNDERDQVKDQLRHIRDAFDDAERELKRIDVERAECNDQLQHLLSELNAAEEELDRRDIERAECDMLHRDLVALKQSSGITEIIEQRDQLAKQVQLMSDKDALYDEIESKSNQSEKERVYWENTATSMIDKIKIRNRKEVLDDFGPGPFIVKLTFAFQDSPENEFILIELAPLDLMPHTVHTFLKMTSRKLLSRATFLLARSHILVLGPRDSYNAENDAVLKKRMVSEGYSDGGLLFGESTSEYPHTPYTVSFNKRRGPTFYINLIDNSRNHASYYANDGSFVEGDTCFGKIVQGVNVVSRILSMKEKDGELLEKAVYLVDSEVVNVDMLHG